MNKPEITKFITRPGGLGPQLNRARIEANMSMDALAQRLGWTSSKVAKIENGHQMVTRDQVVSIAAACLASAERTATLLAAWEEFNTAFPRIAGSARRTSAGYDVSDENYKAGYAKGYSDALNETCLILDQWIRKIQDQGVVPPTPPEPQTGRP